MGPVLIPAVIFIIFVIAAVAVVSYLVDQSAEHNDQSNG
jgi:hypothetical protein